MKILEDSIQVVLSTIILTSGNSRQSSSQKPSDSIFLETDGFFQLAFSIFLLTKAIYILRYP